MKKRIRFLVDDPPGIEEFFETPILSEDNVNYYFKNVYNIFDNIEKEFQGTKFVIVIPRIRAKKNTVKSSVMKLFSVKENQDIVDKFARKAYNEKFPEENKFLNGVYHGYEGFDIIDDHTIRVKYSFGAINSDFDYNESFIIDVK